MKDIQTMKKAMRVTMKKMQTMFVRRKPRTTRDDNSASQTTEYDNSQIEDGLEVSEDRADVFPHDNSTEPSPEPLEIFLSSEEEDGDYFSRLHIENRRHRARGQGSRNKISDIEVTENNCEQEGACGPLVPATSEHKNMSQSALVLANHNRQVAPYYRLPENPCRVVAIKSCGELEKDCANLPLELQAKITVIKETLLREYPPFYDFCVIASDDDYDDALQFKEYVSLAFGLAGCTLEDGFISLGAELFDCYESMMDQSSKVFFFVTENFTSSAFCKRLQSGAVFQSLMSKAKKDKEKCVPVFPHGFCRAPLALSGIAGLNPTQRDVTRRSLDNTYSYQLKQRRFVLDMENYNRRRQEFEGQVRKCIADYQANAVPIESPSTLPVTYLKENSQSIGLKEHLPLNESTFCSVPIIQLPENDDHIGEQGVCSTCSQEPVNEDHKLPRTKKARTIKREKKKLNKNFDSNSRKSSIDNSENNGIESGESSDVSDVEDLLNHCGISDEIKDAIRSEIMNNATSSVNVTKCGTVHVGPSIHVIINQGSSTDFSQMDQYINRKCTSSSRKCSESSDSTLSENNF